MVWQTLTKQFVKDNFDELVGKKILLRRLERQPDGTDFYSRKIIKILKLFGEREYKQSDGRSFVYTLLKDRTFRVMRLNETWNNITERNVKEWHVSVEINEDINNIHASELRNKRKKDKGQLSSRYSPPVFPHSLTVMARDVLEKKENKTKKEKYYLERIQAQPMAFSPSSPIVMPSVMRLPNKLPPHHKYGHPPPESVSGPNSGECKEGQDPCLNTECPRCKRDAGMGGGKKRRKSLFKKKRKKKGVRGRDYQPPKRTKRRRKTKRRKKRRRKTRKRR